ncbi:MAG: IS3 family transposase [Ferruginibacter sp.]
MKAIYFLCGISRQGHMQNLQRSLSELDKHLLYIRMIEDVRVEHPGMGLRCIYDMLLPSGIGRDSFICLGLESGYRLKHAVKYTRTTYSIKSNHYFNLLTDRFFNDINQVWSSDITYFYFEGKFYYIVLIMDVYSRRILGYSLANNMRAENNLVALKIALESRGIDKYHNTLIHHSDRGTQYASDDYTNELKSRGIQISMCREVYENTHIERLNDTIKNQYLNRWVVKGLKELENKLLQTIDSYNNTRPHSSLNKMSPVIFERTLANVPINKREKMKIYTDKKHDEIQKILQESLK